MPKLEKYIERKTVEWAERNGWLAIKFTPKGDKAWPDRIFIKRGRHVWIEFKKGGEEPRVLQKYRIKQLLEHGAEAHYVDNLDDAISILDWNDSIDFAFDDY